MRIDKSVIFRICITVIMCIAMLPYQVLYADKMPDNREPVDVGVVLQPGIAMPTDKGVYFGFDTEYMYKIAQYANLKVIYHPYKNNDELFYALQNGEIQMALGISPTPEREQQFLFANNEFFTGQASIRVRSDDYRFTFGNATDFDGKTMGVVRASIMYERAQEWAREVGISPTFKQYDDELALYADMDAGQLDAIIVSGSKFSENYRLAYSISTNSYYPIFNKNQKALKNKIDATMNRILQEDPLYAKKLFDKYRHYKMSNDLPLSEAERKFIADNPVLRVAIMDNHAPFSMVDSDGTARGITPDLYHKIAQELNWQVEFKVYKNRQEIADALHANEVDVYGITTQDIISSEEAGLALTRSFFTLNIFSISRPDVKEIRTAAYIGRMPQNVANMMQEQRSDVKFQAYDSLDECYDAMINREVDAVFCNMAQLNWLTIKRGSDSFVVESIANLYSECCGQLLPQNYILNSILSKTVQSSNIDIMGIISRNIYTQPTTMDILRAIPTKLIVAFFTVLLIITIIVSRYLYYSHQRRISAELSAKQAALDASERARQAESNFLSTMSHDMRTPLNGILGYTRLARKSKAIDDVQQYLERIDISSKLMLALVNDILDLSKLESGKMELRMEEIIPSEHYNSIKSAISMNAETHHIHFASSINVPEDMAIYSDRLRLQQISMNLLSNATKYTHANGHVHWDVSIIEEGGLHFWVEVIKDDGIGMSEAFQQHMFELFTQETRKETLNTRGTGLGLSLVHKFVTLMQGTIQVESQLNKGSTFTIKIPVKTGRLKPTAPAAKIQANAASVKEIPKNLLENIPILLVEDNKINAELMKLMLAEYGATMIDWAHNGQEALELYSSSEPAHYKVILMDLRMPIMDGMTATKKIRALHRNDALIVPIIATSADAYENDVKACLEAGMQCHISKPVDINKLITAISKYI